jgi:hypothetical protein
MQSIIVVAGPVPVGIHPFYHVSRRGQRTGCAGGGVPRVGRRARLGVCFRSQPSYQIVHVGASLWTGGLRVLGDARQVSKRVVGRTQMTNGARKRSGIVSLCSGHSWQSVSLRLSRRALTYPSKALSSARPTNNRTAKARSRRPRRLRRGPSAPMSCAGSIAANRSPTLPRKRQSPTKLRSDANSSKALRRCRRAFSRFFR